MENDPEPIGLKQAVKRLKPVVEGPLHGACYVQPRGGVTRTVLARSSAGAVGAGIVGALARTSLRALAPLGPMPNLMLLGTTDSDIFLYATRGNRGRVELWARIPLQECRGRVDEKLLLSRLTLQLVRTEDGSEAEELVLDTKRIGANRHNTSVLRDLVSRCAGPAVATATPVQPG